MIMPELGSSLSGVCTVQNVQYYIIHHWSIYQQVSASVHFVGNSLNSLSSMSGNQDVNRFTILEHLYWRNDLLHLRCFVVEHNHSGMKKFYSVQPLHLQLLGWDCAAECKYSCMWKTLNDFQLDGSRIPQFYGKVCFDVIDSLTHTFVMLQILHF